MLRIAVCDDNIQELSQISNLIELYRQKNNTILTFKLFNNGIDLLETMQGGEYDVIFLDIFMLNMNGIEVAHEIRHIDSVAKIIFLTSSSEFAAQSYAVEAYYYLLKPASEERLFPVLDKIFYSMQIHNEKLIVKSQSSVICVYFEKLEFVEVINKKLLFHMTDKSIKEVSGALKHFENELLSRSEFIKVHRSFIVNMNWIYKISAKEIITYTEKIIPISRLIHSQVKQTYMEYLFAEKEME